VKTASVRDLRYDFPKIERLLCQGEEVQITKRRKVIARIVPEQKTVRPELPDFIGRMRAIFGDKIQEISGAELISQDRENRF
jgi:antitoxin (DNA-binding transcriptional repressor) of toxin-antitoxin stability system